MRCALADGLTTQRSAGVSLRAASCWPHCTPQQHPACKLQVLESFSKDARTLSKALGVDNQQVAGAVQQALDSASAKGQQLKSDVARGTTTSVDAADQLMAILAAAFEEIKALLFARAKQAQASAASAGQQARVVLDAATAKVGGGCMLDEPPLLLLHS